MTASGTRHIPFEAEPIVFCGEVCEARPEPGALRILPKELVAFDDAPEEEYLIQFDIDLDIPHVVAKTGDETPRCAFTRWRSNLAEFLELVDLGKASLATVDFGRYCEGFDLCLCAPSGLLQLHGRADFPYRQWDRYLPQVIVEQQKPFPWSVQFAFIIDVKVVEIAVSTIDALLANLPKGADSGSRGRKRGRDFLL